MPELLIPALGVEVKKEAIRFQIDQLRKDKMIYALESIALTFIVEVVYFLASVINEGQISKKVALAALLIPLMFFLYMSIGNLLRWRKIRELEAKLNR